MASLQSILVAVIVGACVIYSAWRLTSVRVHLRVIDVLGAFGAGEARPDGWLSRLRNRELSKLGGSWRLLEQRQSQSARSGPDWNTWRTSPLSSLS